MVEVPDRSQPVEGGDACLGDPVAVGHAARRDRERGHGQRAGQRAVEARQPPRRRGRLQCRPDAGGRRRQHDAWWAVQLGGLLQRPGDVGGGRAADVEGGFGVAGHGVGRPAGGQGPDRHAQPGARAVQLGDPDDLPAQRHQRVARGRWGRDAAMGRAAPRGQGQPRARLAGGDVAALRPPALKDQAGVGGGHLGQERHRRGAALLVADDHQVDGWRRRPDGAQVAADRKRQDDPAFHVGHARAEQPVAVQPRWPPRPGPSGEDRVGVGEQHDPAGAAWQPRVQVPRPSQVGEAGVRPGRQQLGDAVHHPRDALGGVGAAVDPRQLDDGLQVAVQLAGAAGCDRLGHLDRGRGDGGGGTGRRCQARVAHAGAPRSPWRASALPPRIAAAILLAARCSTKSRATASSSTRPSAARP